MDADIKAKWIERLRTPGLPQTKAYLHSDDGFCCLGVLTEMAVEEGIVKRDEQKTTVYRRYESPSKPLSTEAYVYGPQHVTSVLPDEVQRWAGIPSSVGRFDGIIDGVNNLADLNDGSGYTFDQIADVIEEKF